MRGLDLGGPPKGATVIRAGTGAPGTAAAAPPSRSAPPPAEDDDEDDLLALMDAAS
jgi:hypothetical protein